MATSIDLPSSDLVAVGRAAVLTLRGSLLRDAGPAAASYLQEAGFAGGPAVHDAFRRWLEARHLAAPEALGVTQFERLAAEFFRDAGWGTLTVGALGDAVATLDSGDWAEADGQAGLDQPACHLSSGMFADFFGRVAEAPLAVMEVECRSAGAERCRFLLGSPETLGALYDAMAEGRTYTEALESV